MKTNKEGDMKTRRDFLAGATVAGVGAVGVVVGAPLAMAAPHSGLPRHTVSTIVDLSMDWDTAEALGYGKARYGQPVATSSRVLSCTGRRMRLLGLLNDEHKFEHVRGDDAGPEVAFEVVGFRQVHDVLVRRGVSRSSLYLLNELNGNGVPAPETPTTVKVVLNGCRSAPVMLDDNEGVYYVFRASYTVYEAPVFVLKLRVGGRTVMYSDHGAINFMQFCNVQYGGFDFENLYL